MYIRAGQQRTQSQKGSLDTLTYAGCKPHITEALRCPVSLSVSPRLRTRRDVCHGPSHSRFPPRHSHRGFARRFAVGRYGWRGQTGLFSFVALLYRFPSLRSRDSLHRSLFYLTTVKKEAERKSWAAAFPLASVAKTEFRKWWIFPPWFCLMLYILPGSNRMRASRLFE